MTEIILAATLWDVLLKSAVISAAAWVVLLCLRRQSSGLRSLALRMVLAGMLILPGYVVGMPKWQAALWPQTPAFTRVQTAPIPYTPIVSGQDAPRWAHASVTTPPVSMPASDPVASTVRHDDRPTGALVFVLLYAVVACVLYARFLGRLRLLHLLRHSSEGVSDEMLLDVLSKLSIHPFIMHPVSLMLGDVPVPVTWGSLRPVIVLPREAANWPVERIRVALIHEMAHISAADWYWQRLADLVCSLYWINPLIWMMAAALRLESEKSADDWVLKAGIPAAEYAECLLAVIRDMRQAVVREPVSAMAHTPQISSRVKLILANIERNLPPSWALSWAKTLAMLTLVLFAGVRSEPWTLEAAVRHVPYANDTEEHREADIASINASLRKFGDGDPNASFAYYQMGNSQFLGGKYADAVKSLDRCLELPSPKRDISGNWTHEGAYSLKFYSLQSMGDYRGAIAMLNPGAAGSDPELAASIGSRHVWLKELTDGLHRQEDKEAEVKLLGSMHSDPRWSRPLSSTESIQLLGILVAQGSIKTAYTPDGRYLGRETFPDAYGNTWNDAGITDSEAGAGKVNTIEFVIRLIHPANQAIYFAHAASSDVAPNWGMFGGESDPANNGVLETDEQAINPNTAGLRILEVSMPTQSRYYTLTLGVADMPHSLPAAQTSPDMVQKPDHLSSNYQWATFSSIASPIPPSAGTILNNSNSSMSSTRTAIPG